MKIDFEFDIGLFELKIIQGNWKKGETDYDCSVYVMSHMLFFDGSDVFEFKYLDDVSIIICF